MVMFVFGQKLGYETIQALTTLVAVHLMIDVLQVPNICVSVVDC
jgi:hypothetical protein